MAQNLRYLDAINDHVLIYDGAMGTNIQLYKLTAEDFGGEKLNGCNDYLVITRPDVIGEIHASFLEVGCEVIETCTFRSNRLTLVEYGLQDRVLEINHAAARLARQTADRYAAKTGKPRYVADRAVNCRRRMILTCRTLPLTSWRRLLRSKRRA